MAAIIDCKCENEWMDATYGPGKRAANPTKHGDYRCMVCRAVHGASSVDKQKTPVKSLASRT
jgi:hypothetical protein